MFRKMCSGGLDMFVLRSYHKKKVKKLEQDLLDSEIGRKTLKNLLKSSEKRLKLANERIKELEK